MARVTSLAGYKIEQYSSPNVGGRMTGHRGIVLHIAQGTYRGTISWQMNPDQRYADGTRVTTTSTWTVGPNVGEWAQMADSDIVAWAQRSGSYDWMSIELAGYAPNPPSVWQVEASAQLLAWAHRTYGVPVQVAYNPTGRGLGHHSMDREGIDPEWGHDACPGAGVIAAKAAIVARANAIIGGDDMELTDRVPSAATADVPNRTVDQVLGDLWKGVHLRQTEFAAEVRTRLSAIEARLADPVDERALAAALGPLLQPGVTVEQIRQLLASVRLTPGA